jgi:FAD:protein FMN transferase
MKQTRMMMTMPITVEIVGNSQEIAEIIEKVYAYFGYIDSKFSVYKRDSEISKINRNELNPEEYSDDMKLILKLADKTRIETGGYFNIITPRGDYNPSGIVKGWAIYQASKMIADAGFNEYFVDAGGDIEARGKYWKVGIRDPKKTDQIAKIIYLKNRGIATSGAYLRGDHIYDPITKRAACEVASMTVIAENVYEADRYVTAAFAMGKKGVYFIEQLEGFEGYMIDHDGIATMTSGFNYYENL